MSLNWRYTTLFGGPSTDGRFSAGGAVEDGDEAWRSLTLVDIIRRLFPVVVLVPVVLIACPSLSLMLL